jgi:hypothetical protein
MTKNVGEEDPVGVCRGSRQRWRLAAVAFGPYEI